MEVQTIEALSNGVEYEVRIQTRKQIRHGHENMVKLENIRHGI